MRNTRRVVALLAIPAVLSGVYAAMAQTGKVEGVWKMVEITIPGPKPTVIANVAPNIVIVTKKYCSMISLAGEQPKLPEKPTDAQKLATWAPLGAGAGACEVKGSTLTVHPVVGKEPTEPGAFTSYNFKFEGDTLVVTPKANEAGPIPNPATIKCKRLE